MRIYYECPDHDHPCGGVRNIYRHVEILCAAGYDAVVLHRRRGTRCTWFQSTAQITHQPPRRIDNAVIVIPECYGPGIVRQYMGVPRVILNQGPFLTFDGYSTDSIARPSPYTDPATLAVLIQTHYSEDYLRYAFPSVRCLKFTNGVDTDLFTPASIRRRILAYMPRKGEDAIRQVVCLLKFCGVLRDVELRPIDGVNEAEAARLLSNALVFLAVGEHEGWGRPAAEAMASGCLAVGYDGWGGSDLWRPEHSYRVGCGDVLGLARAVERALIDHPGREVPLPDAGRRAAEFVRAHHTLELEKRTVLECWGTISEWQRDWGKTAVSVPRGTLHVVDNTAPRVWPRRWVIINPQIPTSDSHLCAVDICTVLSSGLRHYGFEVEVRNQILPRPHSQHVVLGIGTLPYCAQHLRRMPEGTIIWDFEQHGGDSYWTKRLAPIYRGWKGPIWGINEKNIPALRDAGVTYDRIVRLGYAPELVQTAKRPTVQSADVFFGGSLNPRRIALFDEFRRRGIRLDIGNGGVWGGPLWDRIFSAKLVINPHFFSHPKFEQLRVVPLLANAIPVVSEDGDPEGESRFFDGICVAPYAKLADAVQALLSDDTARLELGARGQEIVRGLPMTAELSFLSEGQ